MRKIASVCDEGTPNELNARVDFIDVVGMLHGLVLEGTCDGIVVVTGEVHALVENCGVDKCCFIAGGKDGVRN